MKNIVLIALMLFGMSLPTNARAETNSDSPSVLFWLDFHVNNESDDDDEFIPISSFGFITGKLYSDGQMELTFDNNEAVIVSINLNDSEVNSVEFVPTEGDKSLTFDLDDFGKGMYEVNVTMSDGCVQTAAFEY
mgnify:CR=1 FL=1